MKVEKGIIWFIAKIAIFAVFLHPSSGLCTPHGDTRWLSKYYTLTDPDSYDLELNATYEKYAKQREDFFPSEGYELNGDIGVEVPIEKDFSGSVGLMQNSAVYHPSAKYNKETFYKELHQTELTFAALWHPSHSWVVTAVIAPSYNSDWAHHFERHDVFTLSSVEATYFISKNLDFHASVVTYQDFGPQTTVLGGFDITDESKRFYVTVDAPATYKIGYKFTDALHGYLSYDADTVMYNLKQTTLNNDTNRVAIGGSYAFSKSVALLFECGVTTEETNKIKDAGNIIRSRMYDIPDVSIGIGVSLP